MRNNKLIKRSISNLYTNHYIIAFLVIDHGLDWKVEQDEKVKKIYEKFCDFEKGIGNLPKLSFLYKDITNLAGHEKHNLKEFIDNSVTIHWVFMHKDKLNQYISENIEVDWN